MSGLLPVVSNAGPLMVLAKLNVLHLLKQPYGRVHFPRSVIVDADQLRLNFAEISRRRDGGISPALVERLSRDLFGG